MKKIWWKEAVVYQIYPRSFNDTNGDGIGDINGVIEKLDYLNVLGIDVIWLCPVYKSPNADNGYDISDYQDIMAEMGTMADFDRLLAEAHKRGMKLIIDLVINHTSDEHPWFIESRSSRDNDKRDWYIWRDQPTNWEGIFGGPAWSYDEHTKQYYLHLFAKKQPDLNWENPLVRQALYEMIRWWLDKGIDGFRVDVISYIKKDFSDMPNPANAPYVRAFEKMKNVAGIHEFLQELRDETFAKYDIMTVGEADGVYVEDVRDWISEEDGKINMMFHFENWLAWDTEIDAELDVDEVKAIMTRWQNGVNGVGWNALYLENHDQPRIVSTWRDTGEYWRESATAIACMYFLMQGTPYIYQGQEIGMTNAPFHDIDLYDDVRTKTLYHYKLEEGVPHDTIMRIIQQTSRDHSRTPMQWDSSPNAGFSAAKPWLGLNPNYTWLNVEAQKKDPFSIWSFYKKMIALRRKWQVLIYGSYELLDIGCPTVYAYVREDGTEKFLVLANLKADRCIWKAPEQSELLLGNYQSIDPGELQPYEARVYRLN